MCDYNSLKICIRRSCIALFAILGCLVLLVVYQTYNPEDSDKTYTYILAGIGAGFFCIALIIYKCCQFRVYVVQREYVEL